jgi:hypothetical protein
MKNENQNDPHRISIINNKVLGVPSAGTTPGTLEQRTTGGLK